MRPDTTGPWRKGARRLLQRVGRRSSHLVRTTYGHRQQERDRRARWTALQRRERLFRALHEVYTPEGADIWWRAPNRELAFLSPKAVWEHGDESGREEVEAAVERLQAGAM